MPAASTSLSCCCVSRPSATTTAPRPVARSRHVAIGGDRGSRGGHRLQADIVELGGPTATLGGREQGAGINEWVGGRSDEPLVADDPAGGQFHDRLEDGPHLALRDDLGDRKG